jgi:hypothetical protein
VTGELFQPKTLPTLKLFQSSKTLEKFLEPCRRIKLWKSLSMLVDRNVAISEQLLNDGVHVFITDGFGDAGGSIMFAEFNV